MHYGQIFLDHPEKDPLHLISYQQWWEHGSPRFVQAFCSFRAGDTLFFKKTGPISPEDTNPHPISGAADLYEGSGN